MLVYNGARWVHICKICAVKPVHNVYENNTYLVLAANVAKFALFARALCEMCRICIIHCTFLEFSIDGQRSETSELKYGSIYREMRGIHVIHGICG